MTDWWEHANPGGPMVGPPFIRPLYPPDAAHKGKQPSWDGGDIVAVKRAVWRSGHWPGPADRLDDSYSNQFAHGKSGNVSENGLAGLQRQNGGDPTGWMGEWTYNLIRSARIPAGLPNAGQPLLDQTAVGLLESYARAFAGGDTVRELALAMAVADIGYTESPPGTNGSVYGAWYGMNMEPWCAQAVTYWYEHASDGRSGAFVKGQRYAYVPYIVADARNGANGLTVTSSPIAGDLVCYDWERNGEYDHIGLFETGNSSSWTAIEGNTAVGNDSNGGQVMRRTRDRGDANVVFVRVAEP